MKRRCGLKERARLRRLIENSTREFFFFFEVRAKEKKIKLSDVAAVVAEHHQTV